MKVFSLLLLSLVSLSVKAQSVIDTIKTAKGTMLIYSNRTWTFLEDQDFTGVLNKRVNKFFELDSLYHYVQKWDNNDCFTSDHANDLTKLKDTFELPLNLKNHEGFFRPVPGVTTSHYGFRSGRYHNGIDLDLETGDTVKAAWAGKVRYAKWNDGGFGNLVIVRHYNGLETIYAHLSKHLVAPDQEVKAGEPLGLGGNTGRSYGAHLHFEVRFYDAPMNPEEVINFEKGATKSDTLKLFAGVFKPGVKPSDTWGKPQVKDTSTLALTDNHDHAIDPEAKVTTVKAKAKPTTAKKYYKVKSGDSLSKIASKNNTTVSKLCTLNHIKPTSTIQAGKQLRVR